MDIIQIGQTYRIYGRALGGARPGRFAPLGNKGFVGNLIFALNFTIDGPAQLDGITAQLAQLRHDNPGHEFEPRRVPGGEVAVVIPDEHDQDMSGEAPVRDAGRTPSKALQATCDYCGTSLTEHDEMRTATGGRVCDECVEAMSEVELDYILDDASKELL